MTLARTVRRLRLTAPGQDEVRRMLPRLEDALRCATLPDGDARVLLVRRLVLGRLDQRASAQALARLIEKRVGDLRLEWVAGGTPAADVADFVSFDSPLDARVKLAVRLARGEPCTGWYWPLAVAEFNPQRSAVANLREMAFVIAVWPESRVALPAWVAALVRAGAVGLVAGAFSEEEGRMLLEVAGVALPPPQPRPRAAGRPDGQVAPAAVAGGGSLSHRNTPDPRPAPAAPRSWLVDMLQATGLLGGPLHEAVRRVTRPVYPAASDDRALPAGAAGAASGEPGHAAPAPTAGVQPVRARARPQPAPRMPAHGVASPPAAPRAEASGPELRGGARALASPSHAALEQPAYRLPTAAGGLLFLLPVLQRLGLPAWLLAADAEDAGFASRVLAAALHRLRVPQEDPAWSLVAPLPRRAAPGSGVAGRIVSTAELPWQSPLLAAPRARPAVQELSAALGHARSADAQAVLWLTAARRWLRRAGHIGLASVVVRPASLSLTPTHADMHFKLSDADLRVRRLGLDADPGWLPWFGRVVSFHFRDAPRREPWSGSP